MSRQRIHAKLRKVVSGTAVRPRLAVYRSLNNLSAQLIDDTTGKTLAAANSLKDRASLIKKAEKVGKEIADKAKGLKIKSAVYDRGGFAYKGAVKLLCEAAREGGLTI
ncbi:MAG: 50S ribosomal protein L18 [Patescibacteria group bacterium]